MSDVRTFMWLIPALPLFAAMVTAFFGPRWLKKQSHWPCVLAIAGSCVLSVLVLMAVVRSSSGPILVGYGPRTVLPSEMSALPGPAPDLSYIYQYTWFSVGKVDVAFTLRADALTAVM